MLETQKRWHTCIFWEGGRLNCVMHEWIRVDRRSARSNNSSSSPGPAMNDIPIGPSTSGMVIGIVTCTKSTASPVDANPSTKQCIPIQPWHNYSNKALDNMHQRWYVHCEWQSIPNPKIGCSEPLKLWIVRDRKFSIEQSYLREKFGHWNLLYG